MPVKIKIMITSKITITDSAEKVGNQRLTASLRTLRIRLSCAREGIPFDSPPDADFFSRVDHEATTPTELPCAAPCAPGNNPR
jgi:hypothetical protein